MPKGDELKLLPGDIREYLRQAVRCDWSGRLVTALVAEGSLDNQGVAKPSDFYFTAGQQKFLDTARKILNAVSGEDIKAGLRRSVALRKVKSRPLGGMSRTIGCTH